MAVIINWAKLNIQSIISAKGHRIVNQLTLAISSEKNLSSAKWEALGGCDVPTTTAVTKRGSPITGSM